VARLDPAQAKAEAEAAGVPAYMARLSIFQVLLRHPKLARALNDLLGVMLFDGHLDTRARELVIMRLGWSTGSVYEWTQHWQIARALGVAEEDLLAVRDWHSSDRFGEAERALLQATDETVETGSISRRTWDDLARHAASLAAVREGDTGALASRSGESGSVGEQSPDLDKVLLEVVATIGAWRMVSSWLKSLAVPLEDGVEAWPPDGAQPPSRHSQ